MTEPNKMGYTPGPWRAGKKWQSGAEQGCAILGPQGDELGAVYAFYATDELRATMEANAHLIAAAPTLMEALEGLLGFIATWKDALRSNMTADWYQGGIEKASRVLAEVKGAGECLSG